MITKKFSSSSSKARFRNHFGKLDGRNKYYGSVNGHGGVGNRKGDWETEASCHSAGAEGVRVCNMDTCSGSCIQSGAMDFICLSYDYFALLDLIS